MKSDLEGSDKQEPKTHRAFGAAAIFLGLIGAEVAFFAWLRPWDVLTNENVYTFMMISMGLAFLPLFIVGIFLVAVAGCLVGLPVAAARWYWKRGHTPQTPEPAREPPVSLARPVDDGVWKDTVPGH
jgi:hypothetical protein